MSIFKKKKVLKYYIFQILMKKITRDSLIYQLLQNYLTDLQEMVVMLLILVIEIIYHKNFFRS